MTVRPGYELVGTVGSWLVYSDPDSAAAEVYDLQAGEWIEDDDPDFPRFTFVDDGVLIDGDQKIMLNLEPPALSSSQEAA